MSALQKAIRQNEPEITFQAAATLFKAAPERVWRRIGIAGFEDVGVADFESLLLVIAKRAGKRWRAEVGGRTRGGLLFDPPPVRCASAAQQMIF